MTSQATNNLVFTVDKIAKSGKQYRIKIRLNDECKNGHNDFSITGDMWEAGKPKTDRYNLGGGAIGDKIAKAFPEYAIFNRLHLCDAKGAPMYPDANGFYHMHTDKMSKDKFCEYYRVTAEQYDILATAEDQKHFKYLLYTTGVVEQWEKEAKEAIKLLEELTGCEFVDDSTRYQLAPLTDEERQEMEERINTGYYSEENKLQRANDKRQAERAKIEAEITKEYNAATDKARKEYEAKMLILNSNIPLNNFIFYGHTLTGSFNWKGWEKKVTQEEFNQFLEYAKDKTPEGVKWELKD
ncbi:MAG TPA: hypothetical protein VEA37_09495 [Flavobacterium sp.]|nr:hypothetical protein [Flavobacterium sp.]